MRAAITTAFALLFSTSFVDAADHLTGEIVKAAREAGVSSETLTMATIQRPTVTPEPDDRDIDALVGSLERLAYRTEDFIPATLRDPYAERAFQLSGEIADDLRDEGRRFLQQHYAAGTSNAEIVKQAEELFGGWISEGRADRDASAAMGELDWTPRVERIVVTERAIAYNAGRNEYMLDPEVEVVTGLMFTAQRDSSTCPYCNAWDGKVFDTKDRDAINHYGPPAHPHCHCNNAPVTIFDSERVTPRAQWPVDPKTGRVYEPAKGFGRG